MTLPQRSSASSAPTRASSLGSRETFASSNHPTRYSRWAPMMPMPMMMRTRERTSLVPSMGGGMPGSGSGRCQGLSGAGGQRSARRRGTMSSSRREDTRSGSERQAIRPSGGPRADDLDLLVLIFILELARKAWSESILPIGFTKDSGASELVKTVVPLPEGLGTRRFLAPPPELQQRQDAATDQQRDQRPENAYAVAHDRYGRGV